MMIKKLLPLVLPLTIKTSPNSKKLRLKFNSRKIKFSSWKDKFKIFKKELIMFEIKYKQLQL